MPVRSSVTGGEGAPTHVEVDARWLMAFAAALGDDDARLFDTAATGGIVGHPVFAVAPEWAARDAGPRLDGLSPAEARRGVHLTQHTTIHRPFRPGDRITVSTTIVAVERHRAGALLERRHEGRDEHGAPVWTSYSGGLLRDVEVEGDDARVDGPVWPAGDVPDVPDAPATPIDVAAGLAHVYTECARIWNPIHTDAAVALAAGLPAIILHGTATLALAVSQVVARDGRGPAAVTGFGCRFGAMVGLPSRLGLRTAVTADDLVAFEVLTAAGGRAARSGFVRFAAR